MSGVGKGITASSIGKILQFHGLNVSAVKIDPYVNVDAGTMNPTEHGETFVLEDGYETDQDMGNYERFLNKSLSRTSYMTTGSIYLKVIQDERALKYKGKTVDVVPDIPLSVIKQIEEAGKKEKSDVVIVEIGGTLGEYQNILFIEAFRMMKMKKPNDVISVLVSYLPIPSKLGEMKSKPTQNAVKTMRETGGFSPDIIVGRSEKEIDEKRKEKIAFYSNLEKEAIISAPDVDSIYSVPDILLEQNLDKILLKKLKIKNKNKNQKEIKKWKNFLADKKKAENSKQELKIAVVGKYFDSGEYVLSDAYISVIEALKFASYKNHTRIKLDWINSKKFEEKNGKEKLKELKKYDGVVIPGGFGTTGIEGKISVIEFVRKNKIPFLGLCYGMQLASIEFARNVVGIKDATSYEINPKAKNRVLDLMPEQREKVKRGDFGASMRLGAYPAKIKKGSLAWKIYQREEISERHRHRYELNPEFASLLEGKGLIISGKSPDGKLAEIVELNQKEHPFFLATQFHPELQARPLTSHPVFDEFIKSIKKLKK